MLRLAVARVAPPSGEGDDAMPGWLGESERRRWATLRPAARAAFAASRGLLRELLQAATGVAAACWTVSAEPGSVPRAHAEGLSCEVHVSLSHRLGWVAAAVADTGVGVDIECDRPARSDLRQRAALMLSPAELQEWLGLPTDASDAALRTRWTAKEAWFKACPPQAAPWDFRHVQARAIAPARANTRTWGAPPVQVALSCADARMLAAARCDGLPAIADEAWWHVARTH